MKTTTMAVTGPANVTQPLIMQTAFHLRDPEAMRKVSALNPAPNNDLARKSGCPAQTRTDWAPPKFG